MFDDFIHTVEELRKKNEVFATATVVRREEPSSGKSGDKAVINQFGDMIGWVGGGCVKAIILKEAEEAMKTGKARLVKVGRGAGETAVQQACPEGVVEYRMTCLSEGSVDIFIEPILQTPQLVVVGKSAIAKALVKIGRSAGYKVSAVAPDARPDTFDKVDELFTQLDLSLAKTNSSSSFVVVCTQGEQDEQALEQALRVKSAYVGFVASKKKKAALFDYLKQSGVDPQKLAAVHSPAGLNIHAKRPEEVAISILAEIIQVQHSLPFIEGFIADNRAGGGGEHEKGQQDTGNGQVSGQARGMAKYYINPVCGVPVDISNPKYTLQYKNEQVYFCCDGCKEKFEAEPEKYMKRKST